MGIHRIHASMHADHPQNTCTPGIIETVHHEYDRVLGKYTNTKRLQISTNNVLLTSKFNSVFSPPRMKLLFQTKYIVNQLYFLGKTLHNIM
jgi:hypothetical protein